MTRRALWAAASIPLVLAATPPRPNVGGAFTAQASTVLVRVLEAESRLPLTNAEVIDQTSGVHRLTDQRGEARMTWPSDGQMRIRVRELGFRFVDRDVKRAANSAEDTVTFVLTRLAYGLPEIKADAMNHCAPVGDSTTQRLSAMALEQLRLGADRYNAFRSEYPFHIRAERRTATGINSAGTPKRIQEVHQEDESERWGDTYDPQHVIVSKRTGFSVAILFISSLADSAFWDRHCFTVSGVGSLYGRRMIRLDFTPGPGVLTVDWAGTAYLDSASSLLRRVEYHLTGLRHDDDLQRLDGYTTFSEPSPLIAVPDSSLAEWWTHTPENPEQWGPPDVAQMIRVESIKYRKGTPPQNKSPNR